MDGLLRKLSILWKLGGKGLNPTPDFGHSCRNSLSSSNSSLKFSSSEGVRKSTAANKSRIFAISESRAPNPTSRPNPPNIRKECQNITQANLCNPSNNSPSIFCDLLDLPCQVYTPAPTHPPLLQTGSPGHRSTSEDNQQAERYPSTASSNSRCFRWGQHPYYISRDRANCCQGTSDLLIVDATLLLYVSLCADGCSQGTRTCIMCVN